MEIVPYSSSLHAAAVVRLNARLAALGSDYFQFPTNPPAPRQASSSVWYEQFVATEGGEVFGGYLLKHQRFLVDGAAIDLGNLQLPLSLGQFDSRYAHVSVALVFDALSRSNLLYCLGMGSQDSKLVKLLAAAGWQHRVVPFHFRILSGNRFARDIRLSPGRAGLQFALRVAGHLRFANLGLAALTRLRSTMTPADVELVSSFDSRADELFEKDAAGFSLVGDRSSETLNSWYPEGSANYLRLLVKVAGKAIGWAVVLDTLMRNDKYFGNLRVGTLADCFGNPEHAATIVATIDRFLSDRGVDLIVSNQMHPAWTGALEGAGYRTGPSNFFFYFSCELAERLAASPDWDRRMHLNRGDGDGPIHL